MLTEQEVREMSSRRTWAVLPAMTCAVGAVFLYFVGVGYFRESLTSLAVNRFGDSARDITPIALILPSFAIFLIPSCLAAKYAGRFKTACPSCKQDLSSRANRVLSTRCCPECSERILVGGRTHSTAVYGRYQAIRSRHFLRYWLWAWPALGGLVITLQVFDRSALQRCTQFLWTVPLIGTATAGWAWLRTLDHRYVPPLLASIVLLGLGAALFWQAL
jgi:DNA-directed RNA polymerase subunit RPC12/RpoP